MEDSANSFKSNEEDDLEEDDEMETNKTEGGEVTLTKETDTIADGCNNVLILL